MSKHAWISSRKQIYWLKTTKQLYALNSSNIAVILLSEMKDDIYFMYRIIETVVYIVVL